MRLIVLFVLLSACAANAQFTNAISDYTTNATTMTLLTGEVVGVDTPVGRFMVGFGLMFGWCVFGWALRLVKFVGHSSS